MKHTRTIRFVAFVLLCGAGGYAIGHYLSPVVYDLSNSIISTGFVVVCACTGYWYVLSKLFRVSVPF